ncbi:MAG: peptidoglycan-binding protein [Ruminococcus sp.]|nr:peptidoglycan-binding protein [Ruminococcus sp.]
MFKKSLALVLVLIMSIGIAVSFSGCKGSDGNYPVTVGHTKIKEKPEKVAVLSDNLADIITYMGFSTQICARSNECTQEELVKYITSVGSETAPSVDKIVASGAQLVLIDTPLPDETIQALEDKDIQVIQMIQPSTLEEISTVYNAMGTLLGGNIDGKAKATAAYNRLTTTLTQAEMEVENSTIIKLLCYLYLDENNNLCSYNSTTREGLVLDRVCATNVASNFPDKNVQTQILELSDPGFIFYDSQEVLDYLTSESSGLSDLSALTEGNAYELPKEDLQRQGMTMINTQNFILATMFPESVSLNNAEEPTSLAADYGITITDDMSFNVGASDPAIKAVQQRLIDLGYLVLDTDTTDYYGEKTSAAVKQFQTANDLEADGVAGKETLDLLFMSDTLSVEGKPVKPQSSTSDNTADDSGNDDTESNSTTTQSSETIQSGDYTITLSADKSYAPGDDNEEIKAIQNRLVELDYLILTDGPVTTYGPGTENAISNFQLENGIVATGVADYDTLKLLFSDEALPYTE